MDGTMFQLRSFVHQRLYSAAEEIIGQMEKTLTLVLHEAKEEANNSLRHQLELLQKKSGLKLALNVTLSVALHFHS